MGRRIIAIIAALIVALVGAGAVVAYASSADERAVAGQQVRTVFIARSTIPEGTSAKQAAAGHLIAPAQVVAKGVPEGALTELSEDAQSRVALADIPKGTIVLSSTFGTPTKAKAAAGVVPEGEVAITVNLPDPQRIAPLLEPGSHIVIYDTFNPRDEEASELTPDGAHLTDDKEGIRVTRVLLPDVEVLAIGSKTAESEAAAAEGEEAKKAESGTPSALVTLSLPPEDAMVLVHGVQTGTLYAGLRGDGVKIERDKDVTDKTVLAKEGER